MNISNTSCQFFSKIKYSILAYQLLLKILIRYKLHMIFTNMYRFCKKNRIVLFKISSNGNKNQG